MSKKQKQNDLIQKTNLYVVKKGDTLYSISRKYNISVQELKNLNNIKDSNISVGQPIKIIN
jgi:LysM repeat protein